MSEATWVAKRDPDSDGEWLVLTEHAGAWRSVATNFGYESEAVMAAAAPAMFEALRPFASFGDFLEVETEGFADTDEFALCIHGHTLGTLTVREFRAALAALLQAQPSDEGEW